MTSNDDAARKAAADNLDAPVWQPSLPDGDEAGPEVTAEAVTGAPEMEPLAAETHGVPAPRAHPPRRNRSTSALLIIASMVAVGGIAFAVGHSLSSPSSGANQVAGFNGGNGQLGPAGSFAPGQLAPDASGAPAFDRDNGGRGFLGGDSNTITGTVVNVSADSMTVQLSDGQTVTIALGSSTTYHTQTPATAADVTTGASVIVQTTTGTATANASPGTTTGRTATDVTVTSN
jgi:hypothetical protein